MGTPKGNLISFRLMMQSLLSSRWSVLRIRVMGEILVLYEGQKQTFLSARSVPDTARSFTHAVLCLPPNKWLS